MVCSVFCKENREHVCVSFLCGLAVAPLFQRHLRCVAACLPDELSSSVKTCFHVSQILPHTRSMTGGCMCLWIVVVIQHCAHVWHNKPLGEFWDFCPKITLSQTNTFWRKSLAVISLTTENSFTFSIAIDTKLTDTFFSPSPWFCSFYSQVACFLFFLLFFFLSPPSDQLRYFGPGLVLHFKSVFIVFQEIFVVQNTICSQTAQTKD